MVAAPMQLAAAAGVEASVGYDSTVVNQLTLQFGDGALARTALDIQLGHRTDTLRQILRVRGEAWYLSGEGRSIDYSNLTAFSRYTLQWNPDDNWRLNVEAGYNIGQAPLMFQRAGDPSMSFFRGVFGEYLASLRVQRAFDDRARVGVYAGTNGRHTVEVPAGTPRGDMLVARGGAEAWYDLGERDNFGVTGNVEGLQMAGLGAWLLRVTSFATWRHAWTDHVSSGLSAGLDALQDQTDPTRSRWNTGPYFNGVVTTVFPEAGLAASLMGRFEFTNVNGVRCAAADILPDGNCRPDRIVAGGAGRIGGLTLQLLWRPLDDNRLILTGTAGADYGVTQNFQPTTSPGIAPTVRPVANANVTAGLGARWVLSRSVSLFTRYTFLFQYVEEPEWFPDIVRHVVLAGVTLTTTAGEADYLDGIVAWEEATTAAAIRAAVQSSPGADARADEAASTGVDDTNGLLDDPLDPGDRPADLPPSLRAPRPEDPPDPRVPQPGAPVRRPTDDPRAGSQPGATRASPPSGSAPTGTSTPSTQGPASPEATPR